VGLAAEINNDAFLKVMGRFQKDATTHVIRDEGRLVYEMRFSTKKSPKKILNRFHNYLDENQIPYESLTTDPEQKVMAHILQTEIEGEKKRVLVAPAGFKSNELIVVVRSAQNDPDLQRQYPPLATVFPEVGNLFGDPYISQEVYSLNVRKGIYGTDVKGSVRSAITKSVKKLRASGWQETLVPGVNDAAASQDSHVVFLKKENAFLTLVSTRGDGQTTLIGTLKHSL